MVDILKFNSECMYGLQEYSLYINEFINVLIDVVCDMKKM